ncbi:MAG: 16S rRNA (cytidine(1402)-2'-O)-methyltransferase [Sneathiellaceae bacterium]
MCRVNGVFPVDRRPVDRRGVGSKDGSSTRQAASSSGAVGRTRSDGSADTPSAGPGDAGRSDPDAGAADLQASDALAPGLYIVATPIGNLQDLTFRARDVLARADTILCEDTRVTARLCAAHGIDRPMRPYHDHNAPRVRPGILAQLAEGGAVALVSDAGTPLIADPGYRLVREARAAGIAVVPIPGPASPIAALCAAGLPTDRFYFGGFLGQKSEQRRRALRLVAGLEASLVFLTGTARLPAVLADMAAELGPAREAVIARELTKRFEEFVLMPLGALADSYAASGPPKGEVVIMVAPPPDGPAELAAEDLDAALLAALAAGTVRSAADEVAQAYGLKRRTVYARALELRDRVPTAQPPDRGGSRE